MTHLDLDPDDLKSHNRCRTGLYTGLNRLLHETDAGDLLVRGAFFVNDCADLATHPDAMVCLWDSLRAERVAYREYVPGSGELVEVHGSPDIVVEIISDESFDRDTRLLPAAYFQAGVREYWLIDARKAKIDFGIRKRAATAFEPVPPDASGYVRSGVLDRSFRITRRKNPVGGWRYSLEDQPST